MGGAVVCALERESGRLAARRTRLHGRRLSAPTHGTSVPLPGPRGPLMMAMPYRREATWRELDGLTSARPLAPARFPLALSS